MEDEELWDFDSESLSFEKDRHILYLEMMYQLLPAPIKAKRSTASLSPTSSSPASTSSALSIEYLLFPQFYFQFTPLSSPL
ncbi:geranylgeranyl transferase type-1 subunit beta-like [Salvia divinorum]|uniref:Geranylgeranyl transferase type-1 subunit beta-like n=1 Tax=Salvia divinorum TaxID=28513 RepID=A0ABD1GDM4_SALDI